MKVIQLPTLESEPSYMFPLLKLPLISRKVRTLVLYNSWATGRPRLPNRDKAFGILAELALLPSRIGSEEPRPLVLSTKHSLKRHAY